MNSALYKICGQKVRVHADHFLAFARVWVLNLPVLNIKSLQVISTKFSLNRSDNSIQPIEFSTSVRMYLIDFMLQITTLTLTADVAAQWYDSCLENKSAVIKTKLGWTCNFFSRFVQGKIIQTFCSNFKRDLV